MQEFKDVLYYLRSREGLTQLDLAKVLNISASTVGMYEQGKRFPKPEIEEAIADYFNVSLNMLRGISDEVPVYDSCQIELLRLFSLLDSNGKNAVMSMIHALLKD